MKVEGFKSQEELIDNLYQASTLADKNARPYAGSDISIEEVNINAFQPTQRMSLIPVCVSKRICESLFCRIVKIHFI